MFDLIFSLFTTPNIIEYDLDLRNVLKSTDKREYFIEPFSKLRNQTCLKSDLD